MRSFRVALLSALCLATISTAASAATQIGKTNEFLFGYQGNKYSFSLSLVPELQPGPGTFGLTVPALGIANGTGTTMTPIRQGALSQGNVAGESVKVVMSSSSNAGTATIGTYAGSVSGFQAPTTAGGSAFSGNYFGLRDNDKNGQVQGSISFNSPSSNADAQRSTQILWGSVAATDSFALIDAYYSVLTGAEVLAAAKTLGIDGGVAGTGSYYVTFNTKVGIGFNAINAMLGATQNGNGNYSIPTGFTTTNNMEFAVLEYSDANSFGSRDSYAARGVDGLTGAGAAPAPLPALAGTIPGLLAVAGALGLRRKRRAG